ncbi:MAG: mechanosensitive ion channel family protein [Spirulina sp. DLM2.Bin59]|nr:MAG: mechanosensitive ion channel family protein [Spirulina sp. DLM2.Bin59]
MIKRGFKFFALLVLTVVGVVGMAMASPAQITGLDFSIEEVSGSPNIPTVKLGTLEIAPVFLDGYPVLTVATETLGPNAQRSGEAALRSDQISRRLQQVLASMTSYSREELADLGDRHAKADVLATQLVLTSEPVNEVTTVIKATFPENTTPQVIFTITEADALYSRQSLEELSQWLTNRIHGVLLEAWERRQPAVILRAALWAIFFLFLTIFSSGGLALWQKRLRAERQTLRQPDPDYRPTQHPQIAEDREFPSPLELFKLQVNKFTSQRDYNINAFLRQTVFWGQILLWVVSVGLLSRSFYFTRPFANWLLGVWPGEWLRSFGQYGILGTPLLLLLLFLGVSFLDHSAALMIDRVARQWLEAQTEAIASSHRFSLRVPTLVSAAKGVSAVICYALFILMALNQFRAISTPLTAFLGIITFAISLGAQNFIKDVINGTLILLEDQYAVGDVVGINNQVNGLVEYVNLRITQLRNLDGELITIPNGTITLVRNMTNSWSQAKLVVTVSHETDIEQAMAVMEAVAADLYADPHWCDQVTEEPKMLGVEQLDANGCQLLLLLKTQPMRHWDVAREYRRRLKQAFTEEAIAIGIPRQRLFIDYVTPGVTKNPP